MGTTTIRNTINWRTTFMKLTRFEFTVMVLLTFAVMFILATPDSSGERKGEDGDPEEEGDWIIDSPGNYIGNETDWEEVIDNGPGVDPTIVPHEDHVVIDGNILIEDGGELTLWNTTINMTDHDGYTFIIEEGGTLILENEGFKRSTIHNNNGSLIGTFDVLGTLIVNNGTIRHANYFEIFAATTEVYFGNATFETESQSKISGQIMDFHNVNFTANSSSALELFNSTITWKNGALYTYGDETEEPTLKLKEATITGEKLLIYSFSSENTLIEMQDSHLSLTGNSMINSGGRSLLIEADGSIISITGNTRLNTRGPQAIIVRDSEAYFADGKLGFSKWDSIVWTGIMDFDRSDVTFENFNIFRMHGNGLTVDSSNLTMINCNFWNISGNGIDFSDGNMNLQKVGFYNVSGNGIDLMDSTASLINVTMDEDDLNHTNGMPYPPVFAGYGNGVLGYGIFTRNSEIEIENSQFAATENEAIYLIDSTLSMQGSMFRSPGVIEDDMVHGIYFDNSTGDLHDNTFNTPYRKNGFDIFAVDTIPFDIDEFTANNEFNDGRTFQVMFTLNVKVINEDGDGVSDVEVNLTNNVGEDTRISETEFGGWVRTSFIVPTFEIYHYEGVNNETNESYEYFTNKTFNEFSLIATKEYRTFNFTITTEMTINLTESVNLEVLLNVSTAELSVLGAAIFPQVLEGDEIEIGVVLRNFGEGWANDVNISYYYALNDTREWTWFGSDIRSVPGVFSGGNHTQYTTDIVVNAPLGNYEFRVVVDPDNLIEERDDTNNEMITAQGFTVLSRPRVYVDHPMLNEYVNGTYLITGYAEDDYQNDISIQLRIDGVDVSVTDITNTGEMVLWSYAWDTTFYDTTVGDDKYPNGEHQIGAHCINTNPSGFDESDWYNVTAIVTNPPEVHFLRPAVDEFINITGALPLYTVEVKVDVFHDLNGVKYQVDDGSFRTMSLAGSVFKATFDTSKYADGHHTITYLATYAYGNLTETRNVMLNSNSEDTLPVIDVTHELTEAGLTVQGTAHDDFKVEWVKIRLDDGSWKVINDSTNNYTSFEHYWERGVLSPSDAHSFTVMVFDGFDTVETVQWFQVPIIYDLVIKDIELPTNVKEGQWVNFTVIVENTGPYASPEVNLILYVGSIMRTVDGISVPANSEIRVDVSWKASPPTRYSSGNISISAEINPMMKSEEKDSTNNLLSKGNLYVTATSQIATDDDDTNISSYLMIAAIIAIILGIVAIGAFLTGGKKGNVDHLPPPPPPITGSSNLPPPPPPMP